MISNLKHQTLASLIWVFVTRHRRTCPCEARPSTRRLKSSASCFTSRHAQMTNDRFRKSHVAAGQLNSCATPVQAFGRAFAVAAVDSRQRVGHAGGPRGAYIRTRACLRA
eukprot:3014136-Pleurochrysis_carterae.AAC.2